MQRVEEDSRMTSYTHHISGRLRIRYPQLKNNPARAKVVETALRKIDGVLSVETSAVTGSLLIRYDARAGKRTALLEKLYHAKQQLGLVPYAPAPAARTSQQRNVAEVLADKALNMIVEKCIERSTYALLAALL
jgi:copper chaperone CopZ